MAEFIVLVYCPVILEIKYHPHISQGSLHLFNLIKFGYQLLSPVVEEFQIFKTSVMNNCWFAYHELVIVALLCDPDQSKRQLGFDLIQKARQNPLPAGEIRKVEKPKEIVFTALDYTTMTDLNKVTITEPPVTFHLSTDQLLDIVDGKAAFKNIIGKTV